MYKIGDKFIIVSDNEFNGEIVYIWERHYVGAYKDYFKVRRLNSKYGGNTYYGLLHEVTLECDWGETGFIPLPPALEILFGVYRR